MNKEQLISEIRNGKALHYDIDNVELLNEVLKEAFPKITFLIEGEYKYFYGENLSMDGYEFALTMTDETTRESITISSLIDTPKMISVEAVKDKLNEMINKSKNRIDQLTKHLNEYLEIHEQGLANNCDLKRKEHEIYFRELNQLLTFLNTHTNVK